MSQEEFDQMSQEELEAYYLSPITSEEEYPSLIIDEWVWC